MINFKMIEKPFVLLFLLCLLPLGVSAQSIVKGIVTDPSGEPVIGATVKVNGSKLGRALKKVPNFKLHSLFLNFNSCPRSISSFKSEILFWTGI